MAQIINIRPSPALIKARQREIARRYRRNYKIKHPFTLAAVRAAELTRLIEHRYGKILPDTDFSIIIIRVMTDHLGHLKDAPRRISSWFQTFTPWLSLASRERVITDATEHPLRYRADTLARKLRVTSEERTALKLRTIGALGQTSADRANLRKLKKRLAARLRRQRQRCPSNPQS